MIVIRQLTTRGRTTAALPMGVVVEHSEPLGRIPRSRGPELDEPDME
jgi:hypothetical protein